VSESVVKVLLLPSVRLWIGDQGLNGDFGDPVRSQEASICERHPACHRGTSWRDEPHSFDARLMMGALALRRMI
jgi:hypothetical protein